MTTPLGSIVIAAHDEEAVIARTLGRLREVVADGLVEVIVVCNGCQDRTAEIARGVPGVRVLELARPSKTAALREGDRVAAPGPRIYLDADVDLTGRAAVATMRALSEGALAGRPRHEFDTTGASGVVRRWYRVRARLPSISHALWGAGCYALSEEGRSRFGEFPEVIADDLLVDRLFTDDEVVFVDTDPVVVHTPLRLADLLRIMRRSYRTQDEVAPDQGLLPATRRDHVRDLREVIAGDPSAALDVLVYVGVVVTARIGARWGPAPRWELDLSSRGQD